MTNKTAPRAEAEAMPTALLRGSRYGSIHRGNGPVRAALEQIPAWSQALAGLRAIAAAPTQAAAHPDEAKAALTARILEALSEGAPVPDDLPQQAADLAARNAGALVVAQAIEAARARLVEQMDGAVAGNWPALFAALADELADVLAGLRRLENIEELADADAAISNDRTDDYRAYRTLLDRYAQLRTEQGRLVTKAGLLDATAGAVVTGPEVLYVRRVDEVFPLWKPWRSHGYLLDRRTGSRRTLSPPWPTDDAGHLTAPVAGGERFLRWALDHGAELWVPTPEEFAAETSRLAAVRHGETPTRMQSVRPEPEADFIDPATVPAKRKVSI